MATTPKLSSKAQFFVSLLKKELNLAKKQQLKAAIEKIGSKTFNTASKVQLVDLIANEIHPFALRYKTEPDGVNRALDQVKNWFRNELGQIVKPASLQNFEMFFQKEFNGVQNVRPRSTKLNQILVQNIWTDKKTYQHPCICPKGPSSLCGDKSSEKCYLCGIEFHMDCLWGWAKNQKSNTSLNECPSCFMLNCLPHKKNQKVLFAGYLPTSKLNKLEFIINFQFPEEMKSNKKINLEGRCTRIKSQADYNRYEITWPDNSTVFFNSKKITDFKLLPSLSSIKRRGDEELVIDKSIAYCNGLETLIIEEKHEHSQNTREYDFASHFIMILAVSQEDDQDLLSKFATKRLSIAESKENLKNYLSSNFSSDIQVEKFSIGLRCPLYFNKITIPVRSRHCSTHFQPFDLKNFLTVNKTLGKGSAQKYKCPICKRRAYDLVIDDYLQDLMNSKDNGENVTEISFRADGEPHFEESKDDESSDEDVAKPHLQNEKIQAHECQKMVDQIEAIDIDLEVVEARMEEAMALQSTSQTLQKAVRLNIMQDDKKIASQIQPGKPVVFGEKKNQEIFDRIQSKGKIPKMFEMISLKKQRENNQIEKDKIAEEKKMNEQKSNPRNRMLNELETANYLPQKPISHMNRSKEVQENRQSEKEQKASIMENEESTSNLNLAFSQAKHFDISSQIVEEKPSIMIEISSDEEIVKQKKPLVNKKDSRKEELKHKVYSLPQNLSRRRRPKQAAEHQRNEEIVRKSKPISDKKRNLGTEEQQKQKSEEESSYEYEYLEDQEMEDMLRSRDAQQQQLYFGESEEAYNREKQRQKSSEKPNEKKRNFLGQINEHLNGKGRKKVKPDNEKQKTPMLQSPIECIELLSDDDPALEPENQGAKSSNDQQGNKIQLQGSHINLNGSQTILQEEQEEVARANYWRALDELKSEIEEMRIQDERRLKYGRVTAIKEDDQKVFYELLEDMDQINHYQLFCCGR